MLLATALRRRCLLKQISHAFSTSTIRRRCSFFKCVGAGAGALATAVHLQAILQVHVQATAVHLQALATAVHLQAILLSSKSF